MKKFGLLIPAVMLVTSCATMNNDFSCNLTASDRCLNLDEVNAMTEDKDMQVSSKIAQNRHASAAPEKGRKIWIAPWKEANGLSHGGEYVYIPMDTITATV